MRLLFLLMCTPFPLMAQNYGPNDPSNAANVTGIGANAWSNPNLIFTSNDAYAVTGTVNGITNYLRGTNFGFSLPATDIVTGIRVEIEKSTPPASDVVLLDSWAVGNNRSLPVGNNRCMVVLIAQKNMGAPFRTITNVSYGGQNLGIYTGAGVFVGHTEKFELWYLTESQLALASGTTINVTYDTPAAANNVEIIASAVYANVDPLFPVDYAETDLINGTSGPFQPSFSVESAAGGMFVTGVFSTNPPNVAASIGNSNLFEISNSFTEMVDYYSANPSIAGSGGAIQIAQKTSPVNSTEQPTFTFSGVPDRWYVIGLSLKPVRKAQDYSVRLVKNGVITGSNKASGTTWTSNDAYTTYGGVWDLWGSNWTFADINNSNFGAAISAYSEGSLLKVDHMRISVYTTSVLPLELVYFEALAEKTGIHCTWITASEKDLAYFELQRSADGKNFSSLGQITAIGNSETAASYSFQDADPLSGINYYRLKITDQDGAFKYSTLVSGISNSGNTTLYPNPATEWATVLTPNGFDEIIISDQNGRIVDRYPGTMLQDKQDLNLYNMPDGTFYVWIKEANGQSKVQSLVKTTR